VASPAKEAVNTYLPATVVTRSMSKDPVASVTTFAPWAGVLTDPSGKVTLRSTVRSDMPSVLLKVPSACMLWPTSMVEDAGLSLMVEAAGAGVGSAYGSTATKDTLLLDEE